MNKNLDKTIFSFIYMLLFFAAIGRIQYSSTLVGYWIQLYRLSIYFIIMLGIVHILLKHKLRINRMKLLLSLMLFYELLVSLLGFGRVNISLFNEFVIDVLAWPMIYMITMDFVNDIGVPKIFRNITICGVAFILSITAINMFQMEKNSINSAIAGVAYCVAVLPLIYLFFSSMMKKILTVVTLIIVIISTKRSSFLALLFGILVYYLSDAIIQEMPRKRINKLLLVMVMAIIASIVGIYMLETRDIGILQRFTSEDTTLSGRTVVWERILDSYGNQGVIEKAFGNGMHAVKYKINIYGLGWYAHNSFIETLYDYGVIGLIILIIFIVVIIRKTVDLNRKKSKLAPVISSTMPHLLIYSFTSYYFEVGQSILFYAFIWSFCINADKKGYLK